MTSQGRALLRNSVECSTLALQGKIWELQLSMQDRALLAKLRGSALFRTKAYHRCLISSPPYWEENTDGTRIAAQLSSGFKPCSVPNTWLGEWSLKTLCLTR